MASSKVDIICITESWLNDSIADGEVVDNTYRMFRRDRDSTPNQKQCGGGVFIAVKKKLQVDTIKVMNQDVEQVFFKVKLEHEDLIIGNIYITPNSDTSLYEKHIHDSFNIINRFPGCKIILMGDYNLPDTKWSSNAGKKEFIGDSEQTGTVLEGFALLELSQTNKVHNSDGKFLDLCFTNCDLAINKATQMVAEDKYRILV